MSDSPAAFAERTTKHEIEKGLSFSPKFDADGLIPCITMDADTSDVLMFAFMNAESLSRTMATGEAHYWSRSRQELWHKGATSGAVQKVAEMRVDCDQDVVLIKVRVAGPGGSCHLGYNSCFFRSVPLGAPPDPETRLQIEEDGPVFDPEAVYGKRSKDDS